MTSQTTFFTEYWEDIRRLLLKEDVAKLHRLASLIVNCHQHGGKTIIVGNGGSAAIASHVSVDLTKAAGIRSACFNESSLLTCFANDFGYEKWVEKALEYYVDEADLVILISSSGRSANMLNAAKLCVSQNVSFVTFSGFDSENPLRSFGNLSFWVDSKSYNHVETIHQTWLLATIDFIVSKKKEAGQ